MPTGRIVKDVVQRIMERTQVPNTYQLGEVCQILAKDNPELSGKGSCWAIVSAVNEFSCTVRTWNGELLRRSPIIDGSCGTCFHILSHDEQKSSTSQKIWVTSRRDTIVDIAETPLIFCSNSSLSFFLGFFQPVELTLK